MEINDKIDVAIQSYKKPESLILTLLYLKKYMNDMIDTIYINDDCSKDGTLSFYDKKFIDTMKPINILIRENSKPSGYTHTCMTKESFKKKKFIKKLQLIGHVLIKRCKFYQTDNDIRYQWAINSTHKKYIFLIHDDMLFFGNVLEVYLNEIKNNPNMAIVGDLGGSRRCPFGPCGTKECSAKKIMNGYRPTKKYPITGKKSFFHTLLGRYNRSCRINEWCCVLNVEIARKLVREEGTYFGNYEGGGDVGTFWFDRIINKGYEFSDPLPTKADRDKYYLHWWIGHSGHSVWVNEDGTGKKEYEKNIILRKLYDEFGYKI